MTTCCVALGSNLQQPDHQVRRAMTALESLPCSAVLKHSSLYQSLPQGPQDQALFINAVTMLNTKLDAVDLLRALQDIERKMGRIKTRHWGERLIDLDLIFYGRQEIKHTDPDLTVPHPHALSRDFVVVPLLEIAPDWRLPNGRLLAELSSQCLSHQLTKLT